MLHDCTTGANKRAETNHNLLERVVVVHKQYELLQISPL